MPMTLFHRFDLANRQTHPLGGFLDRPTACLAHGRQFGRRPNPQGAGT